MAHPIIDAIKTKDFSRATEQFRVIMDQKIAARLAQEMRTIAATSLTEAVEGNWICDECGKKFSAKFDSVWDAKCPKCGAEGEGNVHKSWTQKDANTSVKAHMKEDSSGGRATPGKCAECGKPATWYHNRLGKKFCDKCAPKDTMSRIMKEGIAKCTKCGKPMGDVIKGLGDKVCDKCHIKDINRKRVTEAAENGEPYTAECQECGKKFKSKSMEPKCPKCGGYDIDLGENCGMRHESEHSGVFGSD